MLYFILCISLSSWAADIRCLSARFEIKTIKKENQGFEVVRLKVDDKERSVKFGDQ